MSILQLDNNSNGSDQKPFEHQNLSPRADRRGQLGMTTRNETFEEDPFSSCPISKLVKRKVECYQGETCPWEGFAPPLLCLSPLLSPIQVFTLHPDLRCPKWWCQGAAVGSGVGIPEKKVMEHLMDSAGGGCPVNYRWHFCMVPENRQGRIKDSSHSFLVMEMRLD